MGQSELDCMRSSRFFVCRNEQLCEADVWGVVIRRIRWRFESKTCRLEVRTHKGPDDDDDDNYRPNLSSSFVKQRLRCRSTWRRRHKEQSSWSRCAASYVCKQWSGGGWGLPTWLPLPTWPGCPATASTRWAETISPKNGRSSFLLLLAVCG